MSEGVLPPGRQGSILRSDREWYRCLGDFLVKSMDFDRSPQDPCLFVNLPGTNIIQITYIYVVDILVFCADRVTLDAIKTWAR